MTAPTATSETSPPAPVAPRRGPIGQVVAGSLLIGAIAALVAVLVVAAGAAEHVITASALLGFALGWAVLAAASARLTDQPQRWALVPAAVLAASGLALLLFAPGPAAMVSLGWGWPPLLLLLAGFIAVRARRSLVSWTRAWLVCPVCAVIALAAVGGAVGTVRAAAAPGVPAAGQLYDVGGRELYLECTGTGSPTVVLNSGAGEHTPSWAWIAPAVAQDTRVCSYDRAGLGWSDPAPHPQDAVDLAEDLHTLLAAADVPGPYVLAGHSVGGVYDLVFADRYPADVAGVVLVDSSSPAQFSLPGYAGEYELYRRISALYPSLARLGLGPIAFGGGFAGLPPGSRDAERALGASAADLRGQRDEWSQLPVVFRQASAGTDLGGKPLLVLTAGQGHDPSWFPAQDALAALSPDSAHRTVGGASHMDLLQDEHAAAAAAQGIRDVVQAVRTGTPLRP
jgi:pimeloyl-ACP methyl ester carboxylesterase